MLPLDLCSPEPDATKIEPPVDKVLPPAVKKISAPGPEVDSPVFKEIDPATPPSADPDTIERSPLDKTELPVESLTPPEDTDEEAEDILILPLEPESLAPDSN